MSKTYVWLKYWALKKPVENENMETGEKEIEVLSRSELWHIFKPRWVLTFACVSLKCGCEKRFGLWHVLWCSEHVDAWLAERGVGVDDEEADA